ncbi:calcitonin gene-related peptide type 1 receptor-like [Zophobas morio]|uniref:calcitonin gene-related peptide type 1 receptor-like n=1 Tax=Zophobas morio TaxID=2755281 RepID=UPI0030833E33
MVLKCGVIFTCVVVLLLQAPESVTAKICILRERNFTSEIWDFWTGYYCYNYTPDFRLNFRYTNITGYILNGSQIPVALIPDEETQYFSFHYKDPTSLQYLRKSFQTDHFFGLWINCCEEASDCCENSMTDENVYPTEEYPCPAIWDGWTCFDPAKAGTIQKETCSKQAYSTESDVCELQSEKTCFANGTWNQTTDYGVCAIAPVLRHRHTFNVIALAIATVISFPAVVIFFSLRTFRKNLRYIMHRNLILIIVIRNLLTIMSKQIIILDALNSTGTTVMDENSVACRVLAFFENAAKNGMFACMLADGFYLHKLIVRAFANEPSLTYIYVAVSVLSFLPSLIWAIVRNDHGAKDCWMVDDTNDQWIIDGFRIAILVINFLLLLDIIRVMVMKLKRGSVSQQVKSTFRATLFLIPLFGIHIVIITNRNIVPSNTCEAQDIYYYISYLVEGLQGIMVALLFCYINSEVRGELENAFRKFVLYLEQRFDLKFEKKEDLRRATTATYVEAYNRK